MRPLAVHHVSLKVEDTEAGIAFYTGVLGLALRDDRPELGVAGAWLDAGGEQVHLVEGEVAPDCGQHFALLVDDLDRALSELRAAGVAVSDPVPVGTSRQAFLADPWGNRIELHQAAG